MVKSPKAGAASNPKAGSAQDKGKAGRKGRGKASGKRIIAEIDADETSKIISSYPILSLIIFCTSRNNI